MYTYLFATLTRSPMHNNFCINRPTSSFPADVAAVRHSYPQTSESSINNMYIFYQALIIFWGRIHV